MTQAQKTKYMLGNLAFSSKEQIKRYVQSIFARYEDGQRLNSTDESFVLDLLEWHPSASQKMGCGIHYIKIHVPPPWYNSKGFQIVRFDGSTTDFSYRVCLTPKLADQSVKFLAACRSAIAPQIAAFKRESFGDSESIYCTVTHRFIRWDESHADHYPKPFIDLVDEYLAASQVDVKTVKFTEGDNVQACRFADVDLATHWAEWHRQHAQLRVICGKANTRLGAHRKVS